MRVFLLLSLTMSYAIASDQYNCITPEQNKILNTQFFESMLKENQECSDNDFLKEAKKMYEDYSTGQRETTKRISGKRISGKEKDLYFLKKMTEGRERNSKKYEAAIDQCDTVICVLTKTFGNEESAYRSLSIAYKSGYYLSFKQLTPVDYVWSKKEVRRVSQVIEMMPKHLLNSHSMGQMHVLADKYRKTDDKPGTTALAWARYGRGKSGEITFTDHIRNGSSSSPIKTIAHELAHQHDYDGYRSSFRDLNEISYTSGYTSQNGWSYERVTDSSGGFSRTKLKWKSSKSKSCFITYYAATHPMEDFSEAIAYYMINPNNFKRTCPRNYAFLKKNFFNNREYIDNSEALIREQLLANITDSCATINGNTISSSYSKNFVVWEDKSSTTTIVGEDGMRRTITTISSVPRYFSEGNHFEFEVSNSCMEQIREKVNDLYRPGDTPCSDGKSKNSIIERIDKKIREKIKGEIELKLASVWESREEIKKSCINNKDISKACLEKLAKEKLNKLGPTYSKIKAVFDRDEVYNFKREVKLPMSKDSIDNAVTKCLTNGSYLIRAYIKHSIPLNCKSFITEELKKLGYNIGDETSVMNPSIAKQFKDNEIWETTSEIIKNQSELKDGCLLSNAICVKRKIKNKLSEHIQDDKVIKDLANSIYAAFE